MKKLFWAACLSIVCTAAATAQTVFMENQPWAEVKSKAQAANLYVFMDCYTSWCGPCKALSNEVFPQPEVGEYLNRQFVCCKYDMEKGEGVALHEKFHAQIPGFPTMLVIDPATEQVVHKVVGYCKPQELIARLKAGLSGKTIFAYDKRYAAGERGLDFMVEYNALLKEAMDKERQRQVICDYVESLPVDSLLNKQIVDMYSPYIKDVYSERYLFLVKNISRIAYKGADAYQLESKLASAMSDAVREIIKNESKDADTVKMFADREAMLKKELLWRDVNRFPEYNTRLVLNDVRLKGNIAELDRLLDAERLFFPPHSSFLAQSDMYAYIIQNTKDKKLIQKYLNYLVEAQSHVKSKGFLSMNYYADMAVAYFKLGNQAKAEECQINYEESQNESINFVIKMVPQDQVAEVYASCKVRYNQLRKAIKMKLLE